MKEFKKWAETQRPYDPFCCQQMMEAAWKAALEWSYRVWKHEKQSFRYQIAIEKELNDE